MSVIGSALAHDNTLFSFDLHLRAKFYGGWNFGRVVSGLE